MNTRVVMKVLGVYYAVALGAVWLVAPRSGLANDHGANAVFVARDVGSALVVIGIMNWIVSTQSPTAVRRALWANVLVNAVPMTMGIINVTNGSFDSTGWVGVGAHAIPLAVVLYCLAFAKTAQSTPTPHPARPAAYQ